MIRRSKRSVKVKLNLQEDSSEHDDYSDSGSDFICSSSETSRDDENEVMSDSDSSNEKIFKLKGKEYKNNDIGRKKKSFSNDKGYIIKSDDYFFNSCKNKAISSNNSINKLDIPKLQQNDLQKLLSNTKSTAKHLKNFQELEEINNSQFNKWIHLMQEGFNILLYGLGSKMQILRNFKDMCLNNVPVVMVNGFFPNLSIKSIIDGIFSDLLDINEVPSNLNEALDIVTEEISHLRGGNLYIILNNIEGNMLKNSKAQNILSKLASIKNIHMIASIDHVSAPLIWDFSKLSKFNFLWFDVTTFLPYVHETSFEDSMIVQRSKTLVLSSINNVFLSLTSNSKGIYLIIVKYQLENGNQQHYKGLLFKDLYWLCREAFLVSSDLALRTQLAEFVDHKMVKFRRSTDGSEYLIIPTAKDILQQFYEQSK